MFKEINIRQRMLGAISLISLIVIFLPYILDGEGLKLIVPTPEVIEIPVESTAALKITNAEDIELKIDTEFKQLSVDANKTAIPKNIVDKEKLDLTAWSIQIATYKNQITAKKIVEKLLKKGLTAYIEKTPTAKITLYKVKVGPIPNRKEAAKLVEKIKKEYKVKPLIVRYP